MFNLFLSDSVPLPEINMSEYRGEDRQAIEANAHNIVTPSVR